MWNPMLLQSAAICCNCYRTISHSCKTEVTDIQDQFMQHHLPTGDLLKDDSLQKYPSVNLQLSGLICHSERYILNQECPTSASMDT